MSWDSRNKKWYGPNRKYHFAEDQIPGAYSNDVTAAKHLIKILNDTANPFVIQSTAANYLDAEKYYQKGLKKDAAINYARFNLSAVYHAQNKNTEALAILKEAQKIDHKNERVYYNLGLLFSELKNNQEAKNNFSKAIELRTTNPCVYYNYGILLQGNKMFLKLSPFF